MAQMTALRAHRRGGPEVLVVEQAPVPAPTTGEVLVAVHAAAITFDELTWQETWIRDGVDRTPVIPSHEVSGVVAAMGDGVTGFSPGDEVYGLIPFDRDGAAAEFVAVPATDLAARPTSVSHVVAAALPLAGLTAWQALVDHAKVQRGEKVLVLGGAGGVGAFTVQLAHVFGAEVSATVRSDVADLVRGFGADHVIDTRAEAFEDAGRSYDVVIDTVGGETLERAYTVLLPGGRLVTLSAPPPTGKADEFGVSAIFFIVVSDRDQLIKLAELADTSGLQVAIADAFPLAEGRGVRKRPGRAPASWQDRPGRPKLAGKVPEMYDPEEAITERRSTRLFLRDKPVPREPVNEALELGMRAPSNSNVQPWHVVFTSGSGPATGYACF